MELRISASCALENPGAWRKLKVRPMLRRGARANRQQPQDPPLHSRANTASGHTYTHNPLARHMQCRILEGRHVPPAADAWSRVGERAGWAGPAGKLSDRT